MSPFVKAKLALCFLVLLAVSTMSAQLIVNNKPGGGGGTGTTPPIVYNGGPVMSANPVNVYIIWYGSWNATGSDTSATQDLVQHFLSSFSGSPLALVNTLYSDGTGPVSGTYQLGGPGGTPSVQMAFSTTFDTTTPSTNPVSAFSSTFTTGGGTVGAQSAGGGGTNTKRNITDGGVEKLVATTLNNGQLPRDPNGVYFVLTSSDINESSEGGFCGAPNSNPSKSGFCGWHNHATMNGVDIKFAFVGNPDRCVQQQTAGQCEVQTTGPNSPAVGVGGADGMVNIIAHELSEATTDPDMNAWHNSAGAENADVCNFNFGFKNLCGTGGLCTDSGNYEASWYNQTFGNNNWLIQGLGEPNQTPPSCVPHL